MCIAIKIANVNDGANPCENDRRSDIVARNHHTKPSKTDHWHVPFERLQQRDLRFSQLNLLMPIRPALALIDRAMRFQKLIV